EDAREERLLLRLGAELHERRPDGVDRDHGQRRARAVRLVPEDELLERRAALAAVLLRPADAEPAVGPHAADDVAEDRPPDLVPLRVQRRAQLGREELAVVAADLAAERVLLGREVEVHAVGRAGPLKIETRSSRARNMPEASVRCN